MKLKPAVLASLVLLGACTQTPPGTPPTTPGTPPTPPGTPTTQVLVLKGDAFGNGGTYVELPGVGANESVAVIPLYATQAAAPDAINYRVTATGLTAPAARAAPPSQAAKPAPTAEQRRHEMHMAQLEENRQLALKMRRAGVQPLHKTLSPNDLGTNCPAPYTVGATACDFWVSPADTEVLINATLRFESANAYWFIDNTYANEFSQEELVRMAQIYEDELVPVDTGYFGDFPDADGNGKIFIVFTSLNAYGYVSYLDLFDDDEVLAQLGVHSNEGDIFYAYLPSDNLRFEQQQNPNITEAESRANYFNYWLPSTLVHELKHLISGGIRLGLPGVFDNLEEVWAEEASAVAAEEISPYGSAVTGYAQNQAGGGLSEPQNHRIIGDRNTNGDDGKSFYGYNFLLFWRTAERVGHENFWKTWTAGPEIGVANVEKNAPQLGSFADMMADWSTALMFSNTGLVSGYDYTKLDLRDGTWQPLAYGPLAGQVTGATRSLAAYVGQGTGQNVTLTIETDDPTPYAVVVRFNGTLPY